MAIPRKSAQFTDEQWHQIELARARMHAYKLRIQPYPLEDGYITPIAGITNQGMTLESTTLINRLDKFQGELVRLSDIINKHIKPRKKSGSFD